MFILVREIVAILSMEIVVYCILQLNLCLYLTQFACVQADSRGVAQLLESIVFAIDSVLPLAPRIPQAVVEELEQDLKQMIVRRSFLTIVHACIK